MTDFIKQLGAHQKTLDKTRVAEKEPYLAGGRTVDTFFARYTGLLKGCADDMRARLTTYERAKAAEERRKRDEAARLEREEADRLRREAEEREKAAITAASLEEAIQADTEARQAEADAVTAKKAADAKAAELHTTRGDYGSSSSLRTFWDFTDLDRHNIELQALRYHLPEDAIEKAVRAIHQGGRA